MAGLAHAADRYSALPQPNDLRPYLGARADVFNFDIETRTVRVQLVTATAL